MDVHINLIGRRNLSGEIYRQLRYAITEGRLRPGDCLPASRDLARSLQVSRTTVTVAYDRLAGEGFVITRVAAGTYVSRQIATESKKTRKAGVDSSLRPRAMWDSIYVSNAFRSLRVSMFALVFPMLRCFREGMKRLRKCF